MRSFLSGESLVPSREEDYGTPDEIRADAEVIPMPVRLRDLLALCLRCQTISECGRFQFSSDRIDLPNGDPMRADDWRWEATRSHQPSRGASSVSDAPRRSWFCSKCELYTWHVAEGVK